MLDAVLPVETVINQSCSDIFPPKSKPTKAIAALDYLKLSGQEFSQCTRDLDQVVTKHCIVSPPSSEDPDYCRAAILELRDIAEVLFRQVEMAPKKGFRLATKKKKAWILRARIADFIDDLQAIWNKLPAPLTQP